MPNLSGRLFDVDAIKQPGQFTPDAKANKFYRGEGGGDASTLKGYDRQDRYAIYLDYKKDKSRVDAGGAPSTELTQSYDSLRDAIPGQAARAAKAVKPTFGKTDYPDAQTMTSEMTKTGGFGVNATTPGESTVAWDNKTNDDFRALHDTVAHGGAGTSFSYQGEAIANEAHRRTLPQQAHRAVTAEVLGQATHHEFTGDFVDQKGLYDVPDWAAKGQPRPVTSPRQFSGQEKPRQGRLAL